MTDSRSSSAPVTPGVPAREGDGAQRSSPRGIGLVIASSASTQSGAGFGTMAIPALGSLGVVGMRQLIGALVLLPITRPPIRTWQRAHWLPVILLAFSLAMMNALIYGAFARIELGLAVTLEFLGPLMLGVLGSRTRTDVATALMAGVGVYVLVLPGGNRDVLGISLALLAGVAWASYIVVGRLAARAVPGAQAIATAMAINAVVFLPWLIFVAINTFPTGNWRPWALAAVAGLLSSAIPYGLDNLALHSVPAPVFAVLMSIQPVMAALAGLLLSGQYLRTHEWLGIVIVVTASAVGVTSRHRRTIRTS